MSLRNKYTITLGFILFLGLCKASPEFVIKKADSTLNYYVIGIKTNKNKDMKIIVKLTPISEQNDKIINRIKNKFLFNYSSLKLINVDGKDYSASDLVIEDFINHVRLIYYFTNVGNKKIRTLELNKKEFKIEL